MERQFWEVYVPVSWNDGNRIDAEYHRQWDSKIRAISGGLSVTRIIKGQWEVEGELFDEKMIPCRVLASRQEMDQIVALTLEHYHDQHCVMAYRLSSEVILRYRDASVDS